jgi:hypothetical protein
MLIALLHHKFPLRVYWQEDDARENWHDDDDDDDEVFRIGKMMVRKRIGKKMMRKENGQDDDED